MVIIILFVPNQAGIHARAKKAMRMHCAFYVAFASLQLQQLGLNHVQRPKRITSSGLKGIQWTREGGGGQSVQHLQHFYKV